MVGCFHISRTLKRLLRSSLPVTDGRISEPCSSIVQGQQLWFGLRSLRKFLFQRLGNTLMQLLPAALQQVLVCCLLHQRMFEAVDGFWRIAAAEHELRVFELGERVL